MVADKLSVNVPTQRTIDQTSLHRKQPGCKQVHRQKKAFGAVNAEPIATGLYFKNFYICHCGNLRVSRNLMTFLKLTASIILFVLLGCNTSRSERESYKSKIPITKQYLSSEWLVDSVSGLDSFTQEWVYFTHDDKFWRLSYYNDTYVVDSSLEVKGDKIFSRGQLKYSLYSVDSNRMILAGKGKAYHLQRRGSDNFDRISSFLNANSKKLLINGIWRLDSADYLPAYLPSYCKNLLPGSAIVFEPKGIVKIFEKDSADKCNSYTYKIFDNELSLLEYDMIVNMELVTLTPDSLVFKSKWLDWENPKWTDEPMKAREQGYKIYCTRWKKQN